MQDVELFDATVWFTIVSGLEAVNTGLLIQWSNPISSLSLYLFQAVHVFMKVCIHMMTSYSNSERTKAMYM